MKHPRSFCVMLVIVGLMAAVLSKSEPNSSAATPESTGPVASCLVNGRWGMMQGWDQMGPGMMSDWNATSSMWGMMSNAGMMGSYSADSQPISKADALSRLAAFAGGCGPDVAVGEMLAFGGNYYASLIDAKGNGLGEVLIDRYSGSIYPEPGPNMMWNTRLGLIGTRAQQINYDQTASQLEASTFVAGYLPGATILEGRAFPGYYTFDFGRGQLEGMLSVNAMTGEVWVHTWHGPALETR